MNPSRRWAVLATALASGCALGLRSPPPAAPLSLEGLELPLAHTSPFRLAVEGRVGDRPAEVQFEPASPLTVVAASCAPDSGWGTVSVPSISGRPLRFPLAEVAELQLGGRTFHHLRAGVAEGEQGRCFVRLGSDALGHLALAVDAEARTVSLSRSRSATDYETAAASPPAGRERFLLRLERHPGGDWPLLPVRLTQGLQSLDGVFVLALSQATTTLSRAAADRAGFNPALPDVPGGTPSERPLLPDTLALTPTLSLSHALVRLDPTLKSTHAQGLLGADAWGRFITTVDAEAGVMLLERAAVPTDEPSAFGLEGGTSSGPGLVLRRDEPAGARIYVQPVGVDGAPLAEGCRVGFSLPPSDRGAILRFPGSWADLARSIPECAAGLRAAARFPFSRYERGPDRECAGACAFVVYGPTGNNVCRCEVPPLTLTAQERTTLEQARVRAEVRDDLQGEESGADEPPPEDEPPAQQDGGAPQPLSRPKRPELP